MNENKVSLYQFIKVSVVNKKPQIFLAEKETLVRASAPSVLILLVCKHSDSLTN